MSYTSVATARLPQTYIDAVDALRLCAKSFSPERYFIAAGALQRCLGDDECAAWPTDMATAATYVRMASDNALMHLAAKVERQRQMSKAAVAA